MADVNAAAPAPAEAKTVVLNDVPADGAAAAESKPTREELRKLNWSEKDLDAAEKRGMVAGDATAKKDEKAAAAPVGIVDKAVEKPAAPADPAVKPVPVSGIPEFDLTPEQEAKFKADYGAKASAIYFRMKNERKGRQTAEKRVAELEAQIKGAPPKPAGDPAGDPDQPMTRKEFDAWQQEQEERQIADAEKRQNQSQVLVQAHKDQEAFARSVYHDFDPAMKLAAEVIQNVETLIPEKHRQGMVGRLIREMQIAAAHADQIGVDEAHSAMLAYEIAKYHPSYGKTAAAPVIPAPAVPDPKPEGAAAGVLKPGQVARAEHNGAKRGSSAGVQAGGGKRTISADDVDAAALNDMSAADRLAFRQNHPARWKALVHG